VTKSGTGAWSLVRSNSYTGPTTVLAGTLSLGNGTTNSNLADSAAVIVASGATLHLDYSGTDTVASLSFGGIGRPPGVYSSSNSPFLTGSGTLTVSTGPATDYAGWESFHALTVGQTGDDDHDGMNNLDEYAFGLDPKNGSSVQAVTSMPSPASATFTYTRRFSSLSGLTFSVWTSTGLSDWTEDFGATQFATPIPGTDRESVQVTLSPGLPQSSRRFVRIEAH
jgi:autotransporter-associated beta strand protein